MELNNISINRLVPIYLMSSYLYYELDKSVLTDSQFDYLCKKILDNWDNINRDAEFPPGMSSATRKVVVKKIKK